MTLANYQVPRLKIELDDRAQIEQPSTMTAVANGRCFGGGFWIAPNASANDARFEVMVSNGLGRVGILALVPRVMKGTHVTHPAVRMMQASRGHRFARSVGRGGGRRNAILGSTSPGDRIAARTFASDGVEPKGHGRICVFGVVVF